ncbi:hypothetical protein ES703_42147 [subsurface metagenome]
MQAEYIFFEQKSAVLVKEVRSEKYREIHIIIMLTIYGFVYFSCSTLDRQSTESVTVEEEKTTKKMKKTKERGGKVKHYFIAVSPFSNLSDNETFCISASGKIT